MSRSLFEARCSTRLSLLVAAFALCGTASAQIFVTPTGAGTLSGANWANATKLATAINMAGLSVGPDDIWVKEGTYPANVDGTYNFPSQTSVYGGFIGTETTLASRAGSAFNTLLSGGGTTLVCVIKAGVDDVKLDRFLIAYGSDIDGGGLAIKGTTGSGNAVDTVQLNDCHFWSNEADYGAGVHAAHTLDLQVKNCTFVDNKAKVEGGGMYLRFIGALMPTTCHDRELKLFNSLFVGNSAAYGGGLWYDRPDARMWIYNCEFFDNFADRGGAIYGDSQQYSIYPVHIGNCTIAYNAALSAGTTNDGGGIFLEFSSATVLEVSNSIVWGNTDLVTQGGTPVTVASNIDGTGITYNGSGCVTASAGVSVTYSDIGLGVSCAAWPGTGNINADPLFAAPGTINLQLTGASPCVDAADDFMVLYDYLDLDADADRFEQVPMDITSAMIREYDMTGGTGPGVDDGNTHSYSGGVNCTTSSATAIDNGMVDMGCYELY